ncbi:7-methylguanosine phosphate-specific 5'-nucleotidase [Episyrphus balteatus]|uniref:7-methylguanosine phosphate-specific 5'-nucleotidase n=1 Tax=Episyrphus balteatus TaxID=286459 RepID=UPI0024856A52|nr:7-methylguanosine phosphate-specific 5'-nucleotidase [Episyrphus balteatus]
MAGPNERKFLYLKDIPNLCQNHCKMKDPLRVEKIINEFIVGGVNRLQVVSDFDYTITKQRTEDGSQVLSSFGILNACKSLPTSFVEESGKLYHKYRPIEIDPHIPVEEKVKYMVEWWRKTGDLLVGFPLSQDEIDTIAYDCKDKLRDHTHELFYSLNRLNVPVLVFSAGLGNSVVSVLKHSKVMYPNVKVISNFLQYKGDMVNGFQEPMIHTYNKNETALEGTEYYDLVHSRDHIIVMGDSIGDAGMANGVPSSSQIIKIGFLFDHVEENLNKYMDAFDIVLIDDQTMDVPRAILEIIEKKTIKYIV